MNGENIHPIVGYARRIVALEEEVAGLRGDIREIYAEAKAADLLKGAVRGVVKRLLEDEERRLTREAIEAERDQALASIGILNGRPTYEAHQTEFDLGAAGDDSNGSSPPKRGRGRPRKITAPATSPEHDPDLPSAA